LSRSTRRALIRLLSGAVAIVLFHRGATADEALRIEYSAPPTCPNQAEFLARVQARLSAARAPEPGEFARTVSVAVNKEEDGFSARLQFVDARGETIVRTLSGKTCDEVVSGIALVTAHALEAPDDERREPVPPPASVEAVAPGAPVTATSAAPFGTAAEAGTAAPNGTAAPAGTVTPAATAAPVAPVATAAPTAKKPPAPPAPVPRGEPPVDRFRMGAGLGGGVIWYAGPELPFSADVAFRVGHTSTAASGRVAFRYWTSTAEVGVATTRFQGFSGGLEGCPLAWPTTGSVRLEPCAGVSLGTLEGSAEDSPALGGETSASIGWADARAIARLRFVPEGILEFEAQGELGFPLVRHEFVLANPRVTVFKLPAVGPGVRAGVMLHFP